MCRSVSLSELQKVGSSVCVSELQRWIRSVGFGLVFLCFCVACSGVVRLVWFSLDWVQLVLLLLFLFCFWYGFAWTSINWFSLYGLL